MAREDLQELTGHDLPRANVVIGGTGEQELAERVGGHARDAGRVAAERVHALARLDRPRTSRVVERARDDDVLGVDLGLVHFHVHAARQYGRRRRRRCHWRRTCAWYYLCV